MTPRKSLVFLVAVLALAIAGCSDDDTPADTGNTDTTAPSVASVTPIDVNHIDVVFDENVQRASAEDETNYVIIEETVSARALAAPGDTLLVYLASLNTDSRTVTLSTSTMGAAPYQMSVTGIADAHGNTITSPQDHPFTGTTNADVTDPEIVYRNPGPNATGVGVSQPVVVQFSEIVILDTVDWTGGDVTFDVFVEGSAYILYPYAPLELGNTYTITIVAHDLSGNTMASESWSFTTTNTNDTTPPYLTSSTPGNLTTNVSVNSNLSLTFSEAVNQFAFFIAITPDPGDGIDVWSNSGKTVTFDPDLPLLDDTQYSATILPNSVMDLAGNGIAEVVSITFTTGSSLEGGSITGTLAGDPTSDFAGDPTGAMIIAPYPFPFTSNDFDVYGSDVVEDNGGVYDIRNLPDGVYYPVAVLDTNGDGEIDTGRGDALGAYGANLALGDFEPDSVSVFGGSNVTGVDFPLFDPSAISGTIVYDGIYVEEFHELGIGVFDTTAFDPQLSPDYGTYAYWPFAREWSVDELDAGLVDGVYYVGAYLDANDNFQLDAGDPIGFYGGNTPIPIRIENGGDAVGVVVTIRDPLTASASASLTWPRPAHRAPWLKRLSAVLRQQKVAQRK